MRFGLVIGAGLALALSLLAGGAKAKDGADASAVSPLDRTIASEEIRNLKGRYWIAVDKQDREELMALYAEDVVAEYPGEDEAAPLTTFHGAADATEFVASTPRPMPIIHFGGQPAIEITSPTTAKAVWPMVSFHRPGTAAETSAWWYYHETYERIGGSWKIKTLRLTRWEH